MNKKKQEELLDNMQFVKNKLQNIDNKIKLPDTLCEQSLKAKLSSNKSVKQSAFNNKTYRNLAVAFASFVIIATSVFAFYNNNDAQIMADSAMQNESTIVGSAAISVNANDNVSSYDAIFNAINAQSPKSSKKSVARGAAPKLSSSEANNDNPPAVGFKKSDALLSSYSAAYEKSYAVNADDKYIYYTNSENIYLVSTDAQKVEGVINLTNSDSEQKAVKNIYVNKNNLIAVISETNNNELYDQNTTITINDIKSNNFQNNQDNSNAIATSCVKVVLYDISNKAEPIQKREFIQDGSYITSQFEKGTVRIVSDKFVTPSNDEAERMAYEILPITRESNLNKSQLIEPENIIISPYNSQQNYLIISSLDTDNFTDDIQTISVFGNVNNVYMSPDNVYLYSTNSSSLNTTNLLKINASNNKLTFAASAEIDGTPYQNNSFYDDGKYLYALLNQTAISFKNDGTIKNSTKLFIFDNLFKNIGSSGAFAEDESVNSILYSNDSVVVSASGSENKIYSIDISNAEKPRIIFNNYTTGDANSLFKLDNKSFIALQNNNQNLITLSLYNIYKADFQLADTTVIGEQGWFTNVNQFSNSIGFDNKNSLLYFDVNMPNAQGNFETGYFICKLNKLKAIEKVGIIKNSGALNNALALNNKVYTFYDDKIQIYDAKNLNNIAEIKVTV